VLGISTCWWTQRSSQAENIVKDILDLGLRGVELEYRISPSVYEQLRHELGKSVKVLSVHNFFPRRGEKGGGDVFLLSSTDEEERMTAVKYTLSTMDYAGTLGARAVVLHLGRVDIGNPSERLKGFYRAARIESAEARAFVEEQKRLRRSRAQRNLDAVLRSLDRLNSEAGKRDLVLGIENRYHLHEIPDFTEIGKILREFKGGHVRYWHDMGHAGVQENLGIFRQEELLAAYSNEMIGIHIHDVRGCDDHLAPGQGELDFGQMGAALRSAPIKILEVHAKVEREDLGRGIRFIEAVMAGEAEPSF